jgi:CRISPR-associated protein Cas1
MVKRTLHFSNPAHLSFQNAQLLIELKDEQRTARTIPIEDIGVVILEHPQITLSMKILDALIKANVAIVSCDDHYMPSGMFFPLEGHHTQTERIRHQLNASEPLKKQLWQQTIRIKISNQATVLDKIGLNGARLMDLSQKVKSGDSTNLEAQAAAYYWNQLYGSDFFRSRSRSSPNAQLNYGYAILRSLVARALSASGMYPSVGIHHRNKYNAFCLADDIMEPYRPFVDWMVLNLNYQEEKSGLTKNQKISLLSIPQIDVQITELKRPLFHAVSLTTASLYKCFAGETRKVAFPNFE